MRKKNVKRAVGYSIMMGSSALFAGKLPEPANIPIRIVSMKGSEFVLPIVTVTGAGEAIGQLGKIDKVRRRLK